jgi:hypothetical protein
LQLNTYPEKHGRQKAVKSPRICHYHQYDLVRANIVRDSRYLDRTDKSVQLSISARQVTYVLLLHGTIIVNIQAESASSRRSIELCVGGNIGYVLYVLYILSMNQTRQVCRRRVH